MEGDGLAIGGALMDMPLVGGTPNDEGLGADADGMNDVDVVADAKEMTVK